MSHPHEVPLIIATVYIISHSYGRTHMVATHNIMVALREGLAGTETRNCAAGRRILEGRVYSRKLCTWHLYLCACAPFKVAVVRVNKNSEGNCHNWLLYLKNSRSSVAVAASSFRRRSTHRSQFEVRLIIIFNTHSYVRLLHGFVGRCRYYESCKHFIAFCCSEWPQMHKILHEKCLGTNSYWMPVFL